MRERYIKKIYHIIVITNNGATMNKAHILSTNFLKDYLVTMRPYLFFVSGISGLAGMALGNEDNLIQLFPLFLAFFLSYGFGQALTDCSQIDTDSLSSPYRPLVQGRVSVKDVKIVSLVGLVISGIVFAIYNPINLVLSFTAIGGLGTYTYFKRRWWGGPLYNAWIVLVLGVMGALSTAGVLHSTVSIMTMAAIFFGYANFVLSGYFKDVDADRETGYNTMVVKYGRRVAALLSLCLSILTVASVFVVIVSKTSTQPEIVSKLLFAAGCVITTAFQWLLFKNRSDKKAYLPISLCVHSYIVLLMSLCSSLKPTWIPFLCVFYLLFFFTIKFRPSIQQV